MRVSLTVQWWDGSTVGHLVSRGTIYFVYDEAWLARRHDLSPLSLPFTASAFNGARGIDGLPGLIADCQAACRTWSLNVRYRVLAQAQSDVPAQTGC